MDSFRLFGVEVCKGRLIIQAVFGRTGLRLRLAFAQYSLFLIANLENESINLNSKLRKILNCFSRDLVL